MALLYLDGFEEYGSYTDMFDINTNITTSRWNYYSILGSISISATAKTAQTTITGKSLAIAANTTITLSIPTPTTVIVGMYHQYAAFNSVIFGVAQSNQVSWTGGTTGVKVSTNAAGNFTLTNAATSVVLATSALTYPINAWYHLQLKYVFGAGTSGSLELKVDDNVILSLPGINSTCGAASLGGVYLYRSAGTGYYDDFYVCDDTGTINNDYLGPVGVYTMVPTAAGASTQFTPSTGSNWSCVDEQGANTTDYVTATATTQTDSYTLSDIPGGLTPTNFAGVLVKARSMKSGTNNASLQLSVTYSGSTTYSSTLAVYTGTYIENWCIFETKPGGGNWDLTSLNGLEAGLKAI
jgi:hypothetical protein